MKSKSRWVVPGVFVAVLVATAGGLTVLHLRAGAAAAIEAQYKTPEEARSVYVRFDMEAYDKITATYWQKVKDAELAGLFQLSLQKAAASGPLPLLPVN